MPRHPVHTRGSPDGEPNFRARAASARANSAPPRAGTTTVHLRHRATGELHIFDVPILEKLNRAHFQRLLDWAEVQLELERESGDPTEAAVPPASAVLSEAEQEWELVSFLRRLDGPLTQRAVAAMLVKGTAAFRTLVRDVWRVPELTRKGAWQDVQEQQRRLEAARAAASAPQPVQAATHAQPPPSTPAIAPAAPPGAPSPQGQLMQSQSPAARPLLGDVCCPDRQYQPPVRRPRTSSAAPPHHPVGGQGRGKDLMRLLRAAPPAKRPAEGEAAPAAAPAAAQRRRLADPMWPQDCGSADGGGTKATAGLAIAISPAVSLPREQYRRYLAELQLAQEAAAEHERYKRMAAGDSPAAAGAAAAAFLRGHRIELQQQALLAVIDEGEGGSEPDCGSKAGGSGRMHSLEPTTSTSRPAVGPNRPYGGPTPSSNLPPDASKAAAASAPLPAEVPVAAPSALAAQNRGLVTAVRNNLLEEHGHAALARAPPGADADAYTKHHLQAFSAVLWEEAELAAQAIAEQEGAAAARAMAHGATPQPLSQLLARPLPAPPPAPALWPAPAEEIVPALTLPGPAVPVTASTSAVVPLLAEPSAASFPACVAALASGAESGVGGPLGAVDATDCAASSVLADSGWLVGLPPGISGELRSGQVMDWEEAEALAAPSAPTPTAADQAALPGAEFAS